jgi:Ca2+-binding RTX toxin-like protein
MATSMLKTNETFLIGAAAVGLNTVGTPDNDTLTGGVDDDLLSGVAGKDFLSGLAGNDTLSGGTGEDKLDGGEGNDILYGGGSNDRIFGRGGNDVLSGGVSDDALYGGGGSDTVSYAGTLTDGVTVRLLFGTATGAYGADTLVNIENIIGSSGNDILAGNATDNTIDGGAGNDRLLGRFGDDVVRGGDGGDTVFGGRGSDTLYGGAGDDALKGNVGTDVLYGGDGADQFLFTMDTSKVNTDTVGDFEVGIDKLTFAADAGPDRALAIAAGADGATIVTIGDAEDPSYIITVTTTGGTLTNDDILFV